MTQPRQVVPGQTVFLTRRTERRQFLLRPDGLLNQVFLYLVAFFANKFSMQVSAIQVLSDHYHMVLTDVLGLLPDFRREFNRVLALCVKVLRKWDGTVWEPGKASVVACTTAQAEAQQMVYTWLNAVRAGLVADARQWPGVTTGLDDLDGPALLVKRPNVWLNPKSGKWPEQIELRLTLPAKLAALGKREARRMLRAELERQLGEAQQQRRKHKWKVLGPKRCQKVSPYARATTWEPLRSRNPVLAAGRGCRELLRAAKEQLYEFRQAYREALDKWKAGQRQVQFPYGTWAMVQHHGARVRRAPPKA
jgi:REP element-mobilizing transposase RayT